MIIKIFVYVAAVFFMMSVFGCNSGFLVEDKFEINQETNEANNELYNWILASVDNKQSADTLIKTTYSEEELRTMPNSLEELIEEMPPECIRQAEKE